MLLWCYNGPPPTCPPPPPCVARSSRGWDGVAWRGAAPRDSGGGRSAKPSLRHNGREWGSIIQENTLWSFNPYMVASLIIPSPPPPSQAT